MENLTLEFNIPIIWLRLEIVKRGKFLHEIIFSVKKLYVKFVHIRFQNFTSCFIQKITETVAKPTATLLLPASVDEIFMKGREKKTIALVLERFFRLLKSSSIYLESVDFNCWFWCVPVNFISESLYT